MNASYSHNYAEPTPETGIRHMFLVRVLAGRSTLGHSSMITPPPSYHSTTGEGHIIVTYHDDQAYAEYLIKYR